MRLDRGRVVVEAAQPGVGVALDVGRVRGGPVPAACARRRGRERPCRRADSTVRPDWDRRSRSRSPSASYAGPRRRDHARVVGRERQTLPVVDRSAREPPDEIEHSRVVLEAPAAVGVHAEVRLDDVVVGRRRPGRVRRRRRARARRVRAWPRATSSARGTARSRWPDERSAWIADEEPEGREVREHGRAAVAQKRRDHAGERRQAHDARGHDQRRHDQEQRQRRGQKEAVVARRRAGRCGSRATRARRRVPPRRSGRPRRAPRRRPRG